MIRRPPRSTLFPLHDALPIWFTYYHWLDDAAAPDYARTVDIHRKPGYDPVELFVDPQLKDRKSTRLNSSHMSISYAVFCLKKKRIVRRGALVGATLTPRLPTR